MLAAPVLTPGAAWVVKTPSKPTVVPPLDVALMLDVLAGPDPRDRHSLPREAGSFADLEGADVKGLRIAWTVDFGGYARTDAHVVAAVEAAEVRKRCGLTSTPTVERVAVLIVRSTPS